MTQARRVLIFIGCLLAWTGFIRGQDISFKTYHYTVADGLPDHRISSLLYHSDGFLYVGTQRGLCRFDGYGFIPIQGEGIERIGADRIVINIRPISEHELLIVHGDTRTKDINYDLLSLSTLEVVRIRTDSVKTQRDDILVGGVKYLLRPYPMGSRADTLLTWSDKEGNSIHLKRTGESLDYATLKLKSNETVDLTEAWSSFTSDNHQSHDYSKVIFVGTLNGLVKIVIEQSKFKLLLNSTIENWEYETQCRAIIPVDSHLMYVGTEQGMIKMQLSDEPESLSKNQIIKFHDPGLLNVRGGALIDSSKLYLAPFRSALTLIDLESGEISKYSDKIVGYYTLAKIGRSKFVLATGFGPEHFLRSFDTRSQTFEHIEFESTIETPHGRPSYLLESADGSVWYSTTSALYLLDIDQPKILKAWYATTDAPDSTSMPFPTRYNLSASNVLVIHEQSSGRLLLGLEDGGLNILDPNSDKIEVLTTNDGLSHNTVCGILSDKTGYWLSTYNGLSHFDTTSRVFRNFYRENGLSHNEFNRFSFAKGFDGRYYFGTMNGLTSFFPNEVLDHEAKVNIALTEATYFDSDGKSRKTETHAFAVGSRFEIPASNRSCAFSFSLDDLRNSKASTFAYMLTAGSEVSVNQSSGWRQQGTENTVRFEYLPAGEHKLWVKGISGYGVNSNVFQIDIHVNEVFYKTGWFILCGAVLFIGITFLIYKNRLAQALRIERLRTQLSSDLHDDVGSLLSGVAYQMEVLEQTADESRKGLIRQVAQSSRNAMSRMRDVVWAIDSRKASMQDLTDRFREFEGEILVPLNIQLNVNTNNITPSYKFNSEMRHNVLLIFKEFSSNTIRHADATSISVTLLKTGRSVTMDVQDNGKGFDLGEGTPSGQGLRNIRMRAKRMNGSAKFYNKGGFGVQVEFPV